MIHLDDDTILKYIIDTLDETERSAALDHISTCDYCRQEADRVRGDMERMSAFQLRVGRVKPPPLRRSFNPLGVIAKVAAILAVGFLLGYVVAEMSTSPVSIPVPERLLLSSGNGYEPKYAPSEATDVRSPY
jgi:hypothetical protein